MQSLFTPQQFEQLPGDRSDYELLPGSGMEADPVFAWPPMTVDFRPPLGTSDVRINRSTASNL